ncbi:MAG: CHAT domain-containing protein [Microcystis sp. M017S1]|uniref:CHAT domain-containing protein n=1 Tax=Microcystis sp. M017S1 TaxID=2771107 RepID=UPI00258839B6|nr:CHAT domain-containing tetratricopeptide repeat protein [Microcystis sp. M017S1]MCA2918102.1 CHAT domain-containing protein [Microcystis sp. M017S1]
MDEQRAQAYINLIEQLLACADDEELNNILRANQELIDPEFLQVMENYATGLEQQGNNNNAAWLRNMAQQLGQYLNPQAGSIEEYQEFLLEVLQAEDESNSDPTVVYPILQRRQHLLDDTFAQQLQQFARYVFSEGKTEDVPSIAVVIQNLCIDIKNFPLGSRANKLEIAITGYQNLLEVYTREAFPEDWAMTQNNLGNAYSNRIKGERADNLELAIAALNQSLEVYTHEAFPEDWAMTQNNLGLAYGNRIRGERADNLELAIAACNLSLEVLTRDSFPEDWAKIQNNLGAAYTKRIRGEKADNLELAIAAYKLSLEVRTREAFPKDWAETQNNLGTAYQTRIRGERADNLELAIATLNLSLEVYTREAFPEQWAGTQHNLGIAHETRIRWERADNLELAIAAYNLSLEVYTRDAFPYEWANTQNNLGIAYGNRIRGERADNLEKEITAYNLSLEVYTRKAFPEDWARTQNNLGTAYNNRIVGERADNLELAIAAFNLSLEVYTRDAFPEDWARSQHKLGTAYQTRIKGERADNLELAIAAYNLSLEVRTREAFPENWAGTQNNLGNAYSDRIRGERADNLELAIAAYNLSLEVYTRESFPDEWATTQNNLGTAYQTRIRGERADNLELAIAAYNLSLEVRTREAFPEQWAMTQNNLGNTYSKRIRRERADNLELAIAAYNLSLEVYTREAFPEQWAMTQNNLGAAYSNRIRGKKADNLELAIAAFHLSLEVRTPTAFPINCLVTGRNLGNTANFIEDWETAIKGYNLAIEAVENTRLEALNPQRQQEILSNAMDVYHGIVQSYLNLNQKDRALEYVERSKTRYLVQLLTDRDIYPKGNIPQTIITELDRLRRAIIGEEQQLAIQEQTCNRGVTLTLDQQKQPILNDYTHLNHLKQELNQLIDREITDIDPTFRLTQKVQTISLNEIQSLINQQAAILEWYISGETFLAFIVTSQGLKVWQSSATDRENLINFIKNYREAYENNKTEWIKTLDSRLNQLSEILHIDEILELISPSCKRLIIIPHWFLHIIPLHCLPLKDGQFLYQRFSKGVGYVPSCQLLKLVQLSQHENFDRLFAIKNPTRKGLKPLLGANLEIERISQEFDAEKTIIIGESAASEQTLENRRQELQASHCIHFSCHGKFNNESPRDSALMLADPEGNLGKSANLTLAEVFKKLDLRECRLVTFSACESGIIESKADSISDEYVGLPSGFLFAGSSSVVSTLWTVDPLATTLFMAKFYHDLKRISIQDQGSIAIVLNHTQTWLRTLNSQKLAQTKNSQKFQQLLDRVFESKRDRRKFQDLLEAAVKREPYPFANPYYWTAFIATGV